MRNRIILCLMLLFFLFIMEGLSGSSFNYYNQTFYFGGNGSEKIYTIFCEINCTTVFVLPKGQSVSDIVEPTGEWRVNSNNGSYVYVVPDKRGIHTSLDIVSKEGRIFSFILEEISNKAQGKKISKLVRIKDKNESLLRLWKTGDREGQLQRSIPKKKVFSKYRVRDKYFYITKAFDDGIFTYIMMEKSQLRPALFIRKKGKRSGLEVVRYVDDGKKYTVHRVLGKREIFVLKFGNRESVIGRSK